MLFVVGWLLMVVSLLLACCLLFDAVDVCSRMLCVTVCRALVFVVGGCSLFVVGCLVCVAVCLC